VADVWSIGCRQSHRHTEQSCVRVLYLFVDRNMAPSILILRHSDLRKSDRNSNNVSSISRPLVSKQRYSFDADGAETLRKNILTSRGKDAALRLCYPANLVSVLCALAQDALMVVLDRQIFLSRLVFCQHDNISADKRAWSSDSNSSRAKQPSPHRWRT
jgi:hypothetical protein